MNLQNIGKEIKRLRKQAGLTQQQLADNAGIPQQHVCNLEKGNYIPTLKTMDSLLFAMGLTVEIVPLDTNQLNPGAWKELIER